MNVALRTPFSASKLNANCQLLSYGTCSLASSDRVLSLLRSSTADTE
jgi:hypothetical protein